MQMNPNKIALELEQYREILITNLIMLAEVPAPMETSMSAKANLISDRLTQYELLNISKDEVGNVVAIIPGTAKNNSKNIVLLAHIDTLHPETVDHTVRIETESAIGAGLVDNSLGTAGLVTLPYILKKMDIELEHNIILCFATNSLGKSDLQGTRFFLDNFNRSISYGICVEGYPLGRISYQSLGAMRLEITIKIPEEYDWSRFGSANAIVDLNNLMNAILEIPLPSRPKTSIVFSTIKGGQLASHNSPRASLIFDIRSESNELVDELKQKIVGIVKEQESRLGADITINTISRRHLGGLEYTHPLVQSLTKILTQLDIKHRMTPSASDLSAFIDKKIPALTLGLTLCENFNYEKETMYIKPIFKGYAQLLTLLTTIDKGLE